MEAANSYSQLFIQNVEERTTTTALGQQTRNVEPEEIGLAGVFKFSLEDGALIKKYTLSNRPEKHLFNDLVLARDGSIYITDTRTASLYVVSEETDELSLFLTSPEIPYPNGICISEDQKALFVANEDGIAVVSRHDQSIRSLESPEGTRIDGIDGLYFYRGGLIAVQNSNELNRIARFHLDDDFLSVVREEILLEDHPFFDIPTTGIIVGDDFFILANSQLASYDDEGHLFPLEELKEPIILRISLGVQERR